MCSLLDFETVNLSTISACEISVPLFSFVLHSKRVQSWPAPFLPDICVPVSALSTIDARAIWDLIDANRKKKAKNAHSLDMKN